MDASFEEGKHPRGEGGKFTAGSGAKPSSKEEHGKQADYHDSEANYWRQEAGSKGQSKKGRRLAAENADYHERMVAHHRSKASE